MKTKIIALALTGILMYSCSPKLAPTPPTPPPAKVDNTSESATYATKDIALGKSLYENNCAKCHKLYNPKDYNAQEWLPILAIMQQKAKISDAEHDKIYAYLIAN
jgi:cytochrome c5